MYIQQLDLGSFRNYGLESVRFSKGINIIVGDNGQGKTNLLEAIYLLSMARSFRTLRDKEMIGFSKGSFEVAGQIVSNDRDYKIQLRVGHELKKAIKVNEVPISSLDELLGIFNVVVFSPEDLNLVKGSPKERRSFLDRGIAQIKPSYYNLLRDYHKVLLQRNAYLKQGAVDEALLEVYDENLSRFGFKISTIRADFVDKVSQISREYHKEISSNREELSILYDKNIKANSMDEYFMILKKYRREDIFRGASSKGIHRDDLSLTINNMELRDYGSQGQKRSAAIAMKLSEIELIFRERQEYPVVLLDDIFSELDQNRQKRLLETIGKAQTFISTAEELPFDMDYNRIYIDDGKIMNQEGVL
ncbi:MAG: DNA replication/repair protein RecF [Filifactoraceae bacterium]